MSNYLKDRRIELGLSQKEIADYVGVSEATVSRWETGNIANMRRDRIASLSKVLKTTPGFIMTGKEDSFERIAFYGESNELQTDQADITLLNAVKAAMKATAQPAKVSKEEFNMIEQFRKLDESDKEMIKAMLERMAK